MTDELFKEYDRLYSCVDAPFSQTAPEGIGVMFTVITLSACAFMYLYTISVFIYFIKSIVYFSFQILWKCLPEFVKSHLNRSGGRYVTETFILKMNHLRRRRLNDDSLLKRPKATEHFVWKKRKKKILSWI
jgi:hypothetical protein